MTSASLRLVPCKIKRRTDVTDCNKRCLKVNEDSKDQWEVSDKDSASYLMPPC